MHIEPWNLGAVSTLIASLNALMLFIYWRLSPSNTGVGTWIWSLVCWAVSFLLSTNVGGIAKMLDASRGMLVSEGDLTAFASAMPRVLQLHTQRDGIAAYGARFTWALAASEYDAVMARAMGR